MQHFPHTKLHCLTNNLGATKRAGVLVKQCNWCMEIVALKAGLMKTDNYECKARYVQNSDNQNPTGQVCVNNYITPD
jgi:hypothetical protein